MFLGTPQSWSQALPAEAKLSLFVRVPKQIGQPQLQVVNQSSVPVKMYLINEAGHVLAKKENFLADIVSGALNLSFGINPSATCLAGGDPDYDCEGGLQVLAGLSGTNVREKWLQAIYGSGTIAVKHCYQAATQAVAPCPASGSLSGARLIVVQFQVQNQSGQTVDLSFAVKAGSAFYSQYAQLALRVAPDSVQVEHIQDGAISTEKLQDGAVTDSKIQSVSSSKLSGVLDWSKLPAPLSALNACSDGQILVRNNTGGWSCSTVSAYVSSTDVLGQALSGLSTSSGGVITASDTILSAFGKLEYRMAQNDAKVGYTTAQAQQDARAALSSGSSSLSYNQSTGVFQLNIGTTAGTLAAGDDSRITGALQRSGGTMTGSLNMGSQDLTYMGNAVMSPDKFFHLSVHSSAPSTSSWGSGERGRMWFNSVTNTIDYWDGSSVKSLGGPVTSGEIADGTITNTDISNTAAIAWSKLASVSASGRLLGRHSAGSGAIEEISLGSGLSLSGGVLSATGTGGTVTSVGVSVPSFMTSSGGPITSSGTISLSFNNQSNRVVFASPENGVAGVPVFRQLRITDIRSASTGNPSFLAATGACPSGQVLNYNAPTDQLTCQNFELGADQITDGVLPINRGGTGAGPSSLNGNRLIVSTTSSMVEAPAIAASRVLISNANGLPEASSVTAGELAHLSGVTSGIQSQLNDMARLSGRSGGQYLRGGTGSGESLTLESTTHSTKGPVVINPNGGRVGIGIDTPMVPVHIVSTQPGSSTHPHRAGLLIESEAGSMGRLAIATYSNGEFPLISFHRAIGSKASPSAVTNGTILGGISAHPYNGTEFVVGTAAAMRFIATEDHVEAARGSGLELLTIPNGTSTNYVSMRLRDRDIGIGNITPNVKLDVNGAIKMPALIFQPNRRPEGDAAGEISYGDFVTWASSKFSTDTMFIGNVGNSDDLGISNNENVFINYDGNSATPDDGFSFINHGTDGPKMAMRITGNGFVGLGTANPPSRLRILGTGETDDDIELVSQGNVATSSGLIRFMRSRWDVNSTPSEQPPQAGDNLGFIMFAGYVNDFPVAPNNRYINVAEIRARPIGTFNASNNWAGELQFLIRHKTLDQWDVMTTITADGMGIRKNNPAYALDVAGDININSGQVYRINGTQICSSSGCTSSSDLRLKKNISPLANILPELLRLKPARYHYKNTDTFGNRERLGFIAQEVEQVFPEVVDTDEKTGWKSIHYSHLTSVIVQAIKELYSRFVLVEDEQQKMKAEMEKMREEIELLKQEIKKMREEARK